LFHSSASLRPIRLKFATCLPFILTLALSGQQPDTTPKTSPEVAAAITAGAQAFRAGRYADAAASFRKAIELDPNNQRAHLDLGTAYAAQIVPGLETPANISAATLAIAEFENVLKANPGNLIALSQEASVYRNINDLDKSKALEKRLIAVDPADYEAIYTIGAIDWRQAHANAVKILAAEGLTDDGQGNAKLSPASCEVLRTANLDLVEDALANLTRAVDLKPDYADAMSYLNLVLRRRADLHCGEDPAFVSNDLRLAAEWSKKANETRQQSKPPATPNAGESK
jgi:tetratricopeptide (TPR) repeat protein